MLPYFLRRFRIQLLKSNPIVSHASRIVNCFVSQVSVTNKTFDNLTLPCASPLSSFASLASLRIVFSVPHYLSRPCSLFSLKLRYYLLQVVRLLLLLFSKLSKVELSSYSFFFFFSIFAEFNSGSHKVSEFIKPLFHFPQKKGKNVREISPALSTFLRRFRPCQPVLSHVPNSEDHGLWR